METKDSILACIKSCTSYPNEVLLTHTIEGDLQLDSLDRVELILELEDELEVEIPDGAYEEWETVQDIVDYIKRKESSND